MMPKKPVNPVPATPADTWATIKILCNFCGSHQEHVCTAFLKGNEPPAKVSVPVGGEAEVVEDDQDQNLS